MDRLDYLRGEIEAERISYSEVEELQNLGAEGLIPESDVVLREWAGLPEFEDEGRTETMIELRDHYLAMNRDNLIEAAGHFAFHLTRDDSLTYKVGFTQPNAIIAAIEIYPEVTADQIRSSNRWEGE